MRGERGILAARTDHKDRKITQILGRRRMEPWLSEQSDTALSGNEHRRASNWSYFLQKSDIGNRYLGVLDTSLPE
jgi:hypothetical protein